MDASGRTGAGSGEGPQEAGSRAGSKALRISEALSVSATVSRVSLLCGFPNLFLDYVELNLFSK